MKTAKKIIYLIFLFTILNQLLLYTQSLQTDWVLQLGDSNRDVIKAVIPNLEGGISAVGTFYKEENRVIYFATVNQAGKLGLQNEINLPKQSKIAVADMVQTRYGTYVIIGHTITFNEHLQPLFLVLDNEGNYLFDSKLDLKGEGAFHAITLNTEGNLLITGQLNEQLILLEATPFGILNWQQTYPSAYIETGMAIACTEQGRVGITGQAVQKGKKYLSWTTLDLNKPKQTNRTYFENAAGLTLLANRDGTWLVGGVEYGKQEKALLLKIATNNKEQWRHTYEGNSKITSISSDVMGRLYLAGATTAFARGAIRSKLWTVQVDDKGQVMDDLIWGSRQEDYATAIQPLVDGSIVVGGYTGATKKSAVLLKTVSTVNNSEPITYTISAKEVVLIDDNKNNQLDSEEWAYLALPIKNEGETTISELNLLIRNRQPNPAIKFLKKVVGRNLKAQQQQVFTIPIKADILKQSESVEIIIQYQQSDGSTAFLATYILPVKANIQPFGNQNLEVAWIQPNPDEVETDYFISNKKEYPIKVKAISSTPLNKENFQIQQNQLLLEDMKMDVVSLGGGTGQNQKRYTYTLSTTLYLDSLDTCS